MKREMISSAVNDISTRYIQEAENYIPRTKSKNFPWWAKRIIPLVACIAMILVTVITLSDKFELTHGNGSPQADDYVSANTEDQSSSAEQAEDTNGPATSQDQAESTIITSYPMSTSTCYQQPTPGEYFCFAEVNAARDHYEHSMDVSYLLAINIFSENGEINGEELAAEYQRLYNDGYSFYEVNYWEYQGEGEHVEHSAILCKFSENQIQNFDVNEKYGYAMHFITNGDSSAVAFDDSKVIQSFD